MIRHRIHIIFLSLFLFYYCEALTQTRIKAAVDRTTILVGEPIKFTLEATVPTGSNINWFKTDTIAHFEFLQKGELDSAQEVNVKTYRQQFTITSFDSGYWTIPAFRLQAGKQKLKTDTIAINVTYSPADPNRDYHDIKDIIGVEKPSRNYLYWIMGGVTLLVAVVIFYLLRKQKPEKPVPEKASRLSPYEEAMQSLDELSKQQPADNSQVKNYFTRLNDVLRVYLRRRFNFSTLEKTNEEMVLQLRKTKLPDEDFTRLAQALRMNDFIKFAKYIPSEQERKDLFDVIKRSIKLLEQMNTTS